jgi:hypothetical protein
MNSFSEQLCQEKPCPNVQGFSKVEESEMEESTWIRVLG